MNDILTNGHNAVFLEDEFIPTVNFKRKLWQIIPSGVATLICLPFGIMLGWPSPTYPKLISTFSPVSPINITIDQSAMIAGFLMVGNTLGTPFSSMSLLGAKYGIIIATLVMIVGWTVMRFAYSIYFLLGSRLLVGLGFGYGVGQLKMYIKDISQPAYAQILIKLIAFYIFFGIIVAFTLGYFTNFYDFSTVVVIMTSVIFFLCLFLPHSPKEYVLMGKERNAKTILYQIKPNLNADYEIQQLKKSIEVPEQKMTFLQVCRDESTKKYAMIVWMLTFLQQFTGAPATIIYTQVIFMASNCPYPEICAIAYSVLFFASNFIGTFFMNSFNKKSCLLYSSVSVTLTLALNITVFYLNLNKAYWEYLSLITMFLFIFVHSTGLGTIPVMLIQEYFPPKAVDVVSKFQIMQHSILALIITKIFQVLYDVYSLYVPFCLFLSVSIVSSVFIWFVVPYETSVLDKGIKTSEKAPQLLTNL